MPTIEQIRKTEGGEIIYPVTHWDAIIDKQTGSTSNFVTVSGDPQTITSYKTFNNALGIAVTNGTTSAQIYVDSNGYLHTNLPIVSDSFIGAYGATSSSGGGGGGGDGISLATLWTQLSTNTDAIYGSTKIHSSHLDLSAYAPKASPAFTGTPTAPTAAAGTNNTQIATTAYVQTAIANITPGTGGGITGIKVNGSTVTPVSGVVSLTIPTINSTMLTALNSASSQSDQSNKYLTAAGTWKTVSGGTGGSGQDNVIEGVLLNSQLLPVNSSTKQSNIWIKINGNTPNAVQDVTTGNYYINIDTATGLSQKQDTLVSGTNIKTINNTSLLGSGNVAVQPTLVSGTNIKTLTVDGTVYSLLGSGTITISGGSGGGGGNSGVSSVDGMTGDVSLSTSYIPLTGSSAITGSLIPGNTSTKDLGSSSSRWNNIYAVNGDFSGLLKTTGGLSVTGGTSSTSTFYIGSDTKLHCAPQIVFDNNTFLSNACTSIAVPTGMTASTLSSGGVITLGFASGYALPTTAQIANIAASVRSIRLNAADPVTPNSDGLVRLYACTSISVPEGLVADSLLSTGVIAINLAEGYVIPTESEINNIQAQKLRIDAILNNFSGSAAKYALNAYKLLCGDLGDGNVGSPTNPVYFLDGEATPCTLDLTNYVDKTSTQTISGIKTFSNGLNITGGTSARTLYVDSSGALHCTLPFISDSYVSAYGSGNTTNIINQVWSNLAASGSSNVIHVDHIPSGISTQNISGNANGFGTYSANLYILLGDVLQRLEDLEDAVL